MGRFGQFLLSEGKLRPDELKKAIEMQQLVGGRLGTNLLELDAIREEVLLEALGRFRHSRTTSVHKLRQISREVLRLVPPTIARRHFFVPISRRGHTLTLAARDPVDPLVEDELGHLTSCLVRTTLALELRIHEALAKIYQVPQAARLSGLARRLDNAEKPRPVVRGGEEASPSPETTDAAVRPAAPKPAAPKTLAPVAPKLSPAKPVSPPPAARPQALAGDESARELPTPSEVEYIELDDSTKQRIYAVDEQSRTPQGRLDLLAEELLSVSIRDEIGDLLLDYARPYLKRRLLLFHRNDRIVGWRGEGEGVNAEKVRGVGFAAAEPSVFLTLQQGTEFWLGPLTPLPAHRSLIEALGDPAPKDCLVLPITLRARTVAFFYGDNGGTSVSGAPVAEFRRLARKAGVAFEVCILKNKIRTL